ncbi:MAG: CHAT domain-containing protein [Methylobacterium sp.]|uniref:CHAT domain-containing protein n=1 Tax=Methylobacterium sp. TaxID=409 RepID=UPI002587E81E|nr:CHAT domain-containing protein [Methylobacterium sp.]MBY0295361.1 CHAT domain-containing protein [Methylobacterium sp.]
MEDIETVALADARARLQDKEALVLLHVGSHGLYGFLLDRSGRSLAWRSDVRAQVLENLVRSLRSSGDISRSLFPPFSFADAAKLHGLIFGPIEAALDDYRKLVIVGDGPLQAMPYGLLLRRPLDQQASDGTALRAANPKWLIRSHAIALLPSVRTLVAQRANREPIRVGKPFLGVGNPQLADAGDLRSIDIAGAFKGSAGELADVSFLRRLVSLPETADELRTIAKLLAAPPDALVLGAQANERTVRAMDLSDYRIVAFATHGALAGEVNGTSEPGLVLTPPTEASREDDGFLSLSEIIGLRLNADLVILSACNTATSDGRPKAEGLSGLARGFFAAGAQSLLATHWAIPSTSAVKITTGLIAHRAERPDADWAYALRATTLALIDGDGPSEWAHPAYWAGFAAIGVLPLGR